MAEERRTAEEIADSIIAKGGQILLPDKAGDAKITYLSRRSLWQIIVDEIKKPKGG
jgi:hypothetical protein